MKTMFDPNVNLLGNVMNMQLQRQNVITGNIANVNTPSYKPRELEFEAELQKALNLDAKGKVTRSDDNHMPATFDPNSFGADWYKKFTPRNVHGEDRVDLDKEMVKMTKNNLHYTALSQLTKSSFDGLRNIIAEGSK